MSITTAKTLPRTVGGTGRWALAVRTLVVALAGAALLSLAACGGIVVDPATTPPVGSAPAGQARSAIVANPAPSASLIAVLVQTSPVGRTAATQVSRTGAVATVLQAAQAESARLIADEIGVGPGSSDLVANLTLVGNGPNRLLRSISLGHETVAARQALTDLVGKRGGANVDVIAGLDNLADHLRGLPRRTTDVVLLGNLMSTQDPFDLRDPRTLANPRQTIARLAAVGALPDCSGWQVYVIGGGSGSGLADQQQAALRELYRELFAAPAGGSSSGIPTWCSFPTRAPACSSSPVGRRLCRIVLRLPDTLFAVGSASLTVRGERALTRDLRRIEKYPNAKLTITGYADSTPDLAPGGNLALSARRAATVGAWLVGHAVDPRRISLSRGGSSHGAASNVTPQGRQLNRRAEIVISAPAG